MNQQELESFIRSSQKKAFELARDAWRQRFLSDPRKMQLVSSSVHAFEVDKKILFHPLGKTGEYVRLSFLYVFSSQSFFKTTEHFFRGL